MTGRIGIDLGGTKIEGVAIDAAGALLARERVATPRDRYDDTVAADRRAGDQARARRGEPLHGRHRHPGAISPATGLVKNANSTWLNGRRSSAISRRARPAGAGRQRRQLLRALGGRRTAPPPARDRLRRDSRHRHRRRHRRQSARGRRAPTHRRRMGPQPAALAARRRAPGPPCYCGRAGCIETFLSGPAVARDTARGRGGGAAPTPRRSRPWRPAATRLPSR